MPNNGGQDGRKAREQERKIAFTLAETLITLVIVGVVAALTVPNLIVKYQKEQTVTQLKKMYSTLSQTTNRAIADNGPIDTWEITSTSAEATINFLKKYLTPYLSVMKEPTTSAVGHWNRNLSYLNNTLTTYSSSWVRFYLQDGSSVTASLENQKQNKRLYLHVDINGDKSPNKFGRDIFEFHYFIDYSTLSGQFQPRGYNWTRKAILSSSSENRTCVKNAKGNYCAALIMKDGWKISDDYPW